MGAFDQQAAARLFEDATTLPWLQTRRDAARGVWLGGALPTRKTEHWKYTTLEALGARDYLRRPSPLAHPGTRVDALIAGLDADVLVFRNGRHVAELSTLQPQDGVQLLRFADADATQRALIQSRIETLASNTGNPFVALNTCWMTDGVLLHVARGVKARRPLCIVHLGEAEAVPVSFAQRLLVVLEEQSEAELIEYFSGAGAQQHTLLSGTTEIALEAGAQLGHYRLQLEQEQAIHIAGVYVELQRAASYRSFVFGLGGRLQRLDLRVRHRGEGSECRTDGVYLAKGEQHFDLHSNVEHEAARGTTDQVFRGIIDGHAHAVFNGRIHIHQDAQKTSADLNNRNLLLSNTAEIDTKPELEIYADDVKCSHGATVSRIDEKSLYYLQTRGIGREEAEFLLGFGFINELVERVPVAALREVLRLVARRWFGREEDLREALS